MKSTCRPEIRSLERSFRMEGQPLGLSVVPELSLCTSSCRASSFRPLRRRRSASAVHVREIRVASRRSPRAARSVSRESVSVNHQPFPVHIGSGAPRLAWLPKPGLRIVPLPECPVILAGRERFKHKSLWLERPISRVSTPRIPRDLRRPRAAALRSAGADL